MASHYASESIDFRLVHHRICRTIRSRQTVSIYNEHAWIYGFAVFKIEKFVMLYLRRPVKTIRNKFLLKIKIHKRKAKHRPALLHGYSKQTGRKKRGCNETRIGSGVITLRDTKTLQFRCTLSELHGHLLYPYSPSAIFPSIYCPSLRSTPFNGSSHLPRLNNLLVSSGLEH